MYEKHEFCPSCRYTKFNNKFILQDFSITKESFALSECDNCKLLFVNPRPSEDTLPTYYNSDKYISHNNKSNSIINFLYKMVRIYTLKEKLKTINKFQHIGSLMDFGSGTGHFLEEAQKSGWDVNGVEPDQNARALANELTHGSIVGDISDLPKNHNYDVITAWHVLEHVYHLGDTLKSLRKRLQENGTMMIALPNHKSYDAQIYGEYWAGYDIPRHLYHFDKSSFEFVANKTKLEIIEILPMKFDSFQRLNLSALSRNALSATSLATSRTWIVSIILLKERYNTPISSLLLFCS